MVRRQFSSCSEVLPSRSKNPYMECSAGEKYRTWNSLNCAGDIIPRVRITRSVAVLRDEIYRSSFYHKLGRYLAESETMRVAWLCFSTFSPLFSILPRPSRSLLLRLLSSPVIFFSSFSHSLFNSSAKSHWRGLDIVEL